MGLFSGIGSFFGPVGSILGGIGDDLLGRDDAQNANSAQMAQARTLRQTAYQDTTKDLQAAGLNPMLAYTNGATSAAMPTLQNKGLASAQQNSATSVAETQRAQTDNIKADTANKDAQGRLLDAQTKELLAKVPVHETTATNIEQSTRNLQNTHELISAQIKDTLEGGKLKGQQQLTEPQRRNLMLAEEKLTQMDQQLRKGQINLTEAQARTQNISAWLSELEIPMAMNQADYANSDMGKNEPYATGTQQWGKAIGSVMGGIINSSRAAGRASRRSE